MASGEASMEKGRFQSNADKDELAAAYVNDQLQRRFPNRLEQHTGMTLSNQQLASLLTLGDLIRFFSHPAEQQE